MLAEKLGIASSVIFLCKSCPLFVNSCSEGTDWQEMFGDLFRDCNWKQDERNPSFPKLEEAKYKLWVSLSFSPACPLFPLEHLFLNSTSDIIFPAFQLHTDSNLLKCVLKILWINDEAMGEEKLGHGRLVLHVSLLLPSFLWYQLLLCNAQIAVKTCQTEGFGSFLIGGATEALTIGWSFNVLGQQGPDGW